MRFLLIMALLTSVRAGATEIELFEGENLHAWQSISGDMPAWELHDDYVEVMPESGDLRTKQVFGDFELSLEFWLPHEPEKTGQNRANSGIFLQGLYEVQILDSTENPTYADGMCGALYKQIAPSQNACLPAEQWQTLEIKFAAPRVDASGAVLSKGTITVILNGIKVIDSGRFDRPTGSRGRMRQGGPGPIVLQDHGSPVRFRNIRIRTL